MAVIGATKLMLVHGSKARAREAKPFHVELTRPYNLVVGWNGEYVMNMTYLEGRASIDWQGAPFQFPFSRGQH